MTDDNWDDLESEATLADRFAKLQKQRDSLAKQLHEVKHKQSDYLETLWDAVHEAVSGVVVSPVKAPKLSQGKDGRPEEVAIALLSDLQTGKITPDYNTDVCRERVAAYAEKIVKLTAIQRKDHPVRKCVVAMLGDFVEGVQIFPGQQWLIDSTLYRQMFDTTPVIVVEFLRVLLTAFDEVEVWMVDGNHGRIGRRGDFGPEDNADRMTYRVVRLLMRDEPRVTFHQADPAGERAWYKIMRIGNYSALLIHGDQIKGSSGYPWYGLGKKVHSWGSGGLGPDSDFKDLMLGHYHQLARIPLNHRTVWQNGSTESYNTFAQEMLAAQSEPMQWLLFCEPQKGVITASYGVRL